MQVHIHYNRNIHNLEYYTLEYQRYFEQLKHKKKNLHEVALESRSQYLL